MSLQALVMGRAAMLALVASRLAGFVLVSPFPGHYVSTRQRIALVLLLAWFGTSVVPEVATPAAPALLGAVAIEVACGLLVGLAFRFVHGAAEVLGAVLGQASGLGAAAVLNPAMDATETPLGRIVGLLATLLGLTIGAHRIVLSTLLESLRALPVGSLLLGRDLAIAYADLAVASFSLGVQLATPVLGVTVVVQLGLAMISRAAPSLQIFNVGFAVLLASTVATLLTSLHEVFRNIAEHLGSVGPFLDQVLTSMRP